MKIENNKERLDYFDIAKGIAIILVVLGHIIPPTNSISIWLYSFHIPLFFIIAGSLINYKKETENNIKRIIKKKTRSLLIPYVSFSIIYILYSFFNLYILKIGDMSGLNFEIYITLFLRGIGTLWFLPALFIGEMLFVCIMKINIKQYFKLIIIVLLFASAIFIGNYLGAYNEKNIVSKDVYIPILTIFRSFVALFFITIGYYMYNLVLSKNIKRHVVLLIGIILLIVNIFVSKYNAPVDLNFLIFGNVFMYIIFGIIGSLAILLICKVLKHNKILTFLGVNSLIIFALHLEFPFIELTNDFNDYINNNIINLSNYHLETITRLIILLLLQIIPIIIINKYFYLILGRKKNKIVKEKI